MGHKGLNLALLISHTIEFTKQFFCTKRLQPFFTDVATPTGTSYHSPGLVSASHPANRYKPILAYSVELYSKLQEETGEVRKNH